MTTPTVSVVIPTHQRAGRVVRAVASVLAQTRPADEVIVVDDGSRDGTAAVLRERFAAAPVPVRVVEQEHRGVSAARNRGIARAAGEWIALLDSDDEWLPEKLAAQVAAADGSAGCRVVHCDEVWIRDGRRVNPRRRHEKRGGWIYRHCLPLCCISPSAALVHREVFARVGGFDETFPACEDYDLWLRVAARYEVAYVDRTLVVKHGGHADQLSRTVPALDRYRIRALAKVLTCGVLSAADREATLVTLRAKVAVYGPGAARRGRREEAAALAHLVESFA